MEAHVCGTCAQDQIRHGPEACAARCYEEGGHSTPHPGAPVQSAAFTVKAFGLYIIAVGITLLTIPNVLLGLFAIPETREIWVRVVGLLAAILGYYYVAAAAGNARPFFAASIRGRLAFCAGCVALVVLGGAPWTIILFGLADVAGAVWTGLALRREQTAGG